ncbi:1-acyl-sn-glycerol-3-phosphate acyltransferase [Paucibacter soli]|uniref:1-acyl-sn-glycerol-3-phosphate acyltransferase n=1 Tax=Paucibacter soli TaxID=3133433 RepID=UPI00309CC863
MQLPPQVLAGAMPVRPRGSKLARGLLTLAGWELAFDGLPGKQGVIMAYPHTSNWDFVLGLMAKWAFGLNVKFWGKDSLFRVPLFGAWVRWLGGVPVKRSSASGLVADTVARIRAAQAADEEFWLALAPEGTRAYVDGWRSGAYHVAVQAGVPVGLAYFDFGRKRVGLRCFVQLSGDPAQDLALFAEVLSSCRGKRPDQASPVRLKT